LAYAFDGADYTGYNKTTDASGQATFTLPQGNYRFRADKDGTQYWSGASNHCTVPGCTAVTVTASGQAMRPPAGGAAIALTDPGLLLMLPLAAVTLLNRNKRWRRWGWPVACALLVVAVMGAGTSLVEAGGPAVGMQVDSVAEAPQVQIPVPAVLPQSTTGLSQAEATGAIDRRISASASSLAPAAQSSELITTTRTISYTYDPLGRLTAADYSTGEFFAYQYDARRPGRSHGNRTAMTDTAGVHAYAYDAANRLTSVDGVAYTW